MDYIEGKGQFIETWGKLAINWGVNRTIGQVHALLLIHPGHLCADEIMAELKISRGNANTTLRTLISWGLVHKHHVAGERKDFFKGEKDMWKVMKAIIKMRKERELDPMIDALDQVSQVKPLCAHSEEFCKTVKEIKMFSAKAESALNNISSTEAKWLMSSIMKFM